METRAESMHPDKIAKRALRPSEVPHATYQEAFRVVAHIVRSFAHAAKKNLEPTSHRYQNFSAELTDAIFGQYASGDPASVWLGALARRWSVVLAGTADSYPLRIYLEAPTEGHLPWDVACALVRTDYLARIVRTCADQLAAFAQRRAPDLTQASYDEDLETELLLLSVDAPATTEDPWVPTIEVDEALPTDWYRSRWLAVGSFAHGADEKGGNVSLLRTEPRVDRLTGQIAEVPFLSGNAFRGVLRRRLFADLFDRVGVDPTTLPHVVAHGLLSGGSMAKDAKTGGVKVALRRVWRETLPAFDLLAGVLDATQVCPGWFIAQDAVLVCRETGGQFAGQFGEADAKAFAMRLRPAREYVTERQLTARPIEMEGVGEPPLARTQTVMGGAVFAHAVALHGRAGHGAAPRVVQSGLAHALRLMQSTGLVGAQTARGHGQMQMSVYKRPDGATLPSSQEYLDHIEDHRETILDTLRGLRNPQNAPAAPTEGNAPKGRGRASKAAATPAESVADGQPGLGL